MVRRFPRKELQNVLPKCNSKPFNLCYDVPISVSLCLGVSVLKPFAFLSDFPRVCSEICATQPPNAPLPCYYGERVGVRGTAFAVSAAHSLTLAATTPQIAQRRTHPTNPLQLRHFSEISRASRCTKLSIQRIAPSNPPLISAGIMQNLQQVQQISRSVLSCCFI